jgi:hypothetical protein
MARGTRRNEPGWLQIYFKINDLKKYGNTLLKRQCCAVQLVLARGVCCNVWSPPEVEVTWKNDEGGMGDTKSKPREEPHRKKESGHWSTAERLPSLALHARLRVMQSYDGREMTKPGSIMHGYRDQSVSLQHLITCSHDARI